MSPEDRNYYTTEELAELLDVKPITIQRRAKKGEINGAFFLSNRTGYRFLKEEVHRQFPILNIEPGARDVEKALRVLKAVAGMRVEYTKYREAGGDPIAMIENVLKEEEATT